MLSVDQVAEMVGKKGLGKSEEGRVWYPVWAIERMVDDAIIYELARQKFETMVIVLNCGGVLGGKMPRVRDLALDTIKDMYADAGWDVSRAGDEIRLTMPVMTKESLLAKLLR